MQPLTRSLLKIRHYASNALGYNLMLHHDALVTSKSNYFYSDRSKVSWWL